MFYSSVVNLRQQLQHNARLPLVVIMGILSIIGSGGGDGGGGDPGKLQFSNTSYSATEGSDTTVTITVTRTGGSKGAASVDYATTDATATAPSDYTATSGTLNWADGDSASKSFSVSIANDSINESVENLSVSLSNVQTATLGTPSSATITITDDDLPGTLQLSSASYSTSEASGTVTITVTRTGGSTGTVSVDYATSDNTATQPSDYTSTSGTLNWANGDTTDKTFTVPIIDDNALELTEAFNVTLSNPVSATLGSTSTASVSITDNDSIPISGTVSAPGGALAFVQPSLWHRMLTALLGAPVNAAMSDLVVPVAGADVAVYEVDASGALVGGAISSSKTDSFGAYTLAAPTDAPAVKYIVRATGTTETMDSRISGTTVNVDPSTDATSHIITTEVSDLSQLSIQEVTELQEDIAEFIPEIVTSGANASTLSDHLYTRAESGVGQLNVVRSKVSTGQICGHVQSATTPALQDILIVVRDYLDWTPRARTYTDTSGDYCVNVPVQGATNPDGGIFSGDYIIAAFNRTDDTLDPKRSASEWHSSSGTAYTRNDAGKVSVPNTTPVNNVDFILEPGVRLTGTVKATGSLAAVEGAQVEVRDFDTRRRLATTRVDSDGSYRINVIPGNYLVTARNFTMAPYATEVYDGASGTNNRNIVTPVTASAGDEIMLNFVLEGGSLLSGTITDSSNPVVNTRVTIDLANSSTSDLVTTDRNGDYNLWLKPGTFNVYAYGQRSMALDMSSSQTVNFSASVSTLTGHLQDSSSNPVRNGSVRLYLKDVPTTNDTTLVAYATSDNNGDFTLYSNKTGNHLIEARIQHDPAVGSIIYEGETRLLSGTVTTLASVGGSTDLGSIILPDGGVLTGHVYWEDSGSTTLTPRTDFRVQIRDDNDLTTAGSGNQVEDRFLQVRTRGDGSYVVTLPAGIYDRVKMRDATDASTTSNGNCDAITITAGATTVLNFYDGNHTCEVTP